MTARIGILGGTFDPIHYGHLAIAEEARLALGLNKVMFIPAAQQPLKARRDVAPAEQRLAMVRLACASNPAFEPSAIELERPGPSYTVTTLAALRAMGFDNLHFIVGGDALSELPRWYQAARIIELARIVGIQRPNASLDLDTLFCALPSLADRLTLLEGPRIDLSSSELRQRYAAGRPLRYLVPDEVIAYIEQHGLYQLNADEAIN